MSKDRRAGVAARFGNYLAALDAYARRIDEYIGGVRAVSALGDRSLLAFFLPIPVYVFSIYGPSVLSGGGGPGWRGAPPFVVLLLAITVQLLYFRGRRHWMRKLHVLLLSGCTLAAWLLAGPTSHENSGALYRHPYGLLASAAVFWSGIVGPLLARCELFTIPRDEVAAFKRGFDGPSVVAEPDPQPISNVALARAAVTAVTSRPLHVLVPVAFVALFARASWLWPMTLLALLITFFISVMANHDPSRDAIVRFVGRTFLSGAASLVSLVVLALAVCRLAGISYVSTVLDASSYMTILSYLAAAYSLIWLHDFWVYQSAIESLSSRDQLATMQSGEKGALGALRALTPEGVEIERHGEGRVAVRLESDPTKHRIFEPDALLRRIAQTSRDELRDKLLSYAEQSRARLMGFSACMTIGFGVLVGAIWLLAQGTSEPVAKIPRGAPTFDLVRALQPSGRAGDPAIFLAASGGGTRAALYTAAVLHGIERAGRLDGLVVASGVSGGSAALAYFARNRALLASQGEPAWRAMRETLAEPFIEDVLAGALEWRILGKGHLGDLLAESFDAHFALPTNTHSAQTLGDVRGLGLMFNAALCGSAQRRSAPDSPDVRGGFAVLTNLDVKLEDIRSQGSTPWPETMTIRSVIQPSVTLTRAAALSANFPPVFANVPLELDDGDQLWLTDGGAVENRGVIPLLLALSDALSKLPADAEVRPIRIVVAEASALDGEYKSDRGLGAKFGAATQISNGYADQLVARIEEQLRQRRKDHPPDFSIAYLRMPAALRSEGTFGTHWMMPPTVPLGAAAANDKDEKLELESEQIVDLIDGLFREDAAAYITQLFPKQGPDIVKRLQLDTSPLWDQLVDKLESIHTARAP